MRRDPLVCASVASLAMCLVTALFWVRSYNLIWGRFSHSGRHTTSLVNKDGCIEIGWYNEWQTGLWSQVQSIEMRREDALYGSGGGNELVTYLAFRSPQIKIPYVFIVLAELVLRVTWLIRKLRRAMSNRAHLCPTCRYDLTGNISGVCPECGTALATAIEGMGRGLEDVKQGRTRPAREAFEDIRRRRSIPKDA